MSAEPLPPTPACDEDPLLCSCCGYDLRATEGDRCSECGQMIDRVALATSAIPWAGERKRGDLYAYVSTVWRITVGSRSLRQEASRPQDLHKAIAFQRITGGILVVVLLAPWVVLQVRGMGAEALAVWPEDIHFSTSSLLRWMQDVLVPWSAGVMLPAIPPIALALLAIYLTRVHLRLFRLRNVSPGRQQRAHALARYTLAPLAWLLPAGACATTALAVWSAAPAGIDGGLAHPVVLAAGGIAAASLLVTLLRTAQWAARVRHAGLGRAMVALLALPALGILLAVLLLGLFPWCIGFLWIALDSLR